MTVVNDKELAKRLRQNVLNVLDLWTSKDKQLKYQENVPIAQVSSELFNQWGDFYYPGTIHFKLAFDAKEREILSNFNKLIEHVSDKSPTDLPDISEFVNTNDWILLNEAAIDTVKRIYTVANTKT